MFNETNDNNVEYTMTTFFFKYVLQPSYCKRKYRYTGLIDGWMFAKRISLTKMHLIILKEYLRPDTLLDQSNRSTACPSINQSVISVGRNVTLVEISTGKELDLNSRPRELIFEVFYRSKSFNITFDTH